MSLIDREHQHFLQTYKRLPLEVEHAEGMYIHTADGSRYLDFLGGIAVNALGHSHPRVIAAIERQIHRYMHVSNYFYQDAQVDFVERLCRLGGYDRAFLSNSGAEANEGAIKLARAWGSPQGRRAVIGFSGGFHGRTYGVLSVMDKPNYKDGMGPFLPETGVLPYNDVRTLEANIDDTVCALIVEFVQGEGGVRWADRAFIEKIVELRRKHGFLLIADEIQAGIGRTGPFFAFEHFGVRPDIVTVAKGVGGGLPLGGILVPESLASVWKSGQHGTTFGGNAVACAAGSVVLEELENGLMDHVREMGSVLRGELEELQRALPEVITEVRGAGAMFGLELTIPAGPVVEAMLARHVIVNATSDTVIRIVPPLVFERDHVAELVAALRACLTETSVAASSAS